MFKSLMCSQLLHFLLLGVLKMPACAVSTYIAVLSFASAENGSVVESDLINAGSKQSILYQYRLQGDVMPQM